MGPPRVLEAKQRWWTTNPERRTPIIQACLLGRVVLLTYYNTEVFRYPETFQDLDHIRYQQNKIDIISFHNNNLMERLELADYPASCRPWPEPNIEDAFVRANTRLITAEYYQMLDEGKES